MMSIVSVASLNILRQRSQTSDFHHPSTFIDEMDQPLLTAQNLALFPLTPKRQYVEVWLFTIGVTGLDPVPLNNFDSHPVLVNGHLNQPVVVRRRRERRRHLGPPAPSAPRPPRLPTPDLDELPEGMFGGFDGCYDEVEHLLSKTHLQCRFWKMSGHEVQVNGLTTSDAAAQSYIALSKTGHK